ncbi:hypothetical protein Agub_g14599 [Astrephomene gubernaculifera]|uniref:Uncharacterized protein n=1 Tax=Astrephomene gubernaculifera TaxID=47775 RepID=A0AAD3E1Q1_9CHLO|nr:hypothetical protein Agub_g14599 [Astrephomene gubernaculifera]
MDVTEGLKMLAQLAPSAEGRLPSLNFLLLNLIFLLLLYLVVSNIVDRFQGSRQAKMHASSKNPDAIRTRRRAPKPVRDFWCALLKARMTVGSFLVLPSGVDFFGDQDRGHTLLLRQCYWGLFNRIMIHKHSNLYRRFLVTGTPGIGKSCFVVPLLGWLAKKENVIKVVVELNQKRYLFTTSSSHHGPDVEEGGISDFEQELEDTNVWWIVDTGPALYRPANTIFIASLDQNRCKGFQKFLGSTTLYMPVWSDDEMQQCRKRLFPTLQEARFLELQSRWGNIPRYVLEKAENRVVQASLETALGSCDWDTVLKCINETDNAPHASHQLLQLQVLDLIEYDQMVMKPASPYVARKLVEKAGSAHVQDLVQLSLGTPAYAGAARAFYASYVHRRFQEGGTFNVRRLDKPHQPTAMLELEKPPKTCLFSTWEEVTLQQDCVYCIPRIDDLPAVGSIMQPSFLFQMTTTQKLEVNENGLKAAAHQLRGTKRLYFVVPQGMFTTYSAVSNVPRNVEQWLLEVAWM